MFSVGTGAVGAPPLAPRTLDINESSHIDIIAIWALDTAVDNSINSVDI